MTSYAELFCRSNFSFLTGASHPEELVAKAAELGYEAIALTDECSFSGVVRAHVEANKYSIKLIVGAYFKVDCLAEKDLELVLLCPNKQAYTQVSSIITRARRRMAKGEYSVKLSDFSGFVDEAIVLWLPHHKEAIAKQHLTALSDIFLQPPDNERTCQLFCIGYQRQFLANDFAYYQHCVGLAESAQIILLATNGVLMHEPERLALQHCLTAIKYNSCVQNLGDKLNQNNSSVLRSLTELENCYPPQSLLNTVIVAELCQFSLNSLRYDYPSELIPNGQTPIDYLRSLCEQGMQVRWPSGASEKTLATLNKELTLIEELKYEHYFLTVYDIVAFAKSEGILCQGRGSAANSVVCFVLMITEVDPEQSALLFERFISKERNEPPDIDVDFEHQRREQVIQYIYKKYGRERAALAATVITYRMKSAIRDVGKALNIDLSVVDYLSKSLAWWDKPEKLVEYFSQLKFSGFSDSAQDHPIERGEHATQSLASLYHQLVMQILGFPRHLSQHVGGFVITDNPISTLVPVENASMPERTVIQWDKYDIEALGLLKVDVLGLGMLSMIRRCLETTSTYCDLHSMAQITKEDPLVYQMLGNGDSIGVFQVESRAQMSMLPRLKPSCFYDLVIEIAIVRPGPIQGDMVHPYLRRREGTEKVSYPNKAIEGVLGRTLGVPIFQEQVIQLAMVAANFSGGEADQLRRAMASWGRNGDLYKFREKLLLGMKQNGYSHEYAERVFEQMKGFGSYGFPESHSASFAILAYFSAWLKRHHTAAFYCALLNSQPMGFYSPSQLIQDAKRHGITVLPIDVTVSVWETSLENVSKQHQKFAIRLGLHLVKHFNPVAAATIEQVRKQKKFSSVLDLVKRAKLNQKERDALVQANALIAFSKHRYQAQWQALAIDASEPLSFKNKEAELSDVIERHEVTEQGDATVESEDTIELDDFIELKQPSSLDNMLLDFQTTGVSLNEHPLALLNTEPVIQRCKKAERLKHLRHGQSVQIAGVVTCRQRPGTASGVLFLTLEDETGNINVIVWKNQVDKFRKAIMGSRLLLIKGHIERERKVVHVVAGFIQDISELIPAFRRASRDFH